MAVEGAHDTLAALAAGRVATLLVKGDDGREAWFNHAPTDVAPADEDAPVSPDARRGPLVDVAVRTALLTGAQVRVIPPDAEYGPSQGVGGICRYR
jgi:hypothetical protein